MAENGTELGRGGPPVRRWLLGGLARRHPFITGAAAVLGAGLITFVLVWFQPQKLFLNKTVNEPVPGVIQTAPAAETTPHATAGGSPAPRLEVLRSGGFGRLENAT